MAFCANAGARVISLDYASAAIEIAKSVMQEDQIAEKTVVVRADARTLPVSSRSIDVAFMLDVVEHLTYDELITSLTEVERVLKKNGRLIVHTMPNTWYYRFGYPIHRLIMRATGTSLPLDPRTRWSYVDTHVNEQSPYSLGRAMRQAKLDARIWVASSHESSAMPFRRIYDTVVKLPLLSNFVCNDIYAVGKPRQ